MKMIAAMCNSRGIGYKNKLPWNLPEDMNYFREKTIGKHILMGSSTFLSIGKPLPKRTNWVLTRTPEKYSVIQGVNFIRHIDEIPHHIKEDIVVIGGEQIYKKYIHSVRELYLTRIFCDFECDTFFPEIPGDFVITSSSGDLISKSGETYVFLTLNRI